jgi:hypothetical protein
VKSIPTLCWHSPRSKAVLIRNNLLASKGKKAKKSKDKGDKSSSDSDASVQRIEDDGQLMAQIMSSLHTPKLHCVYVVPEETGSQDVMAGNVPKVLALPSSRAVGERLAHLQELLCQSGPDQLDVWRIGAVPKIFYNIINSSITFDSSLLDPNYANLNH